jgi:hypothetical protein
LAFEAARRGKKEASPEKRSISTIFLKRAIAVMLLFHLLHEFPVAYRGKWGGKNVVAPH